MKRTLLLSFLILFLSTDILYAQDFIQEDVGDSKKEENPIDSLYIPVEDWVGKEVIILPKSKALQEFGYKVSNRKSQVSSESTDYNELVGKIATVIEIEGASSDYFQAMTLELENGKKYYTNVLNGNVSDIALLDDIKIARERYLEKTLWYMGNYRGETFDLVINTYNSENNEFGEVKVSKLQPLTVKNIVAGWGDNRPVRFILETENGETGFVDINFSGSNTTNSGRYLYRFEDFFSEINPKEVYDWSEEVWQTIEKAEPKIGMTKDQLILSIGKPTSINNTTTEGTRSEQWVYERSSFYGYIYFENGKLSAIQD